MHGRPQMSDAVDTVTRELEGAIRLTTLLPLHSAEQATVPSAVRDIRSYDIMHIHLAPSSNRSSVPVRQTRASRKTCSFQLGLGYLYLRGFRGGPPQRAKPDSDVTATAAPPPRRRPAQMAPALDRMTARSVRRGGI